MNATKWMGGLGGIVCLCATGAQAQLVTNILTATADTFYDERSFTHGMTNTAVQGLYGPPGTNFLDLASENEPFTQRIVLRFDLSSVPVGSLRSATLRLYNRAGPFSPNTDFLDVYRLTNPFADNNSNWVTNNFPANTAWTNPGTDFANAQGAAQDLSNPFATTLYDRTSVGAANDWDVTSLVHFWQDGIYANYGFMINKRLTQTHQQAFFWSMESGFSPELIVVTPEPTALALLGLGGLLLLGRGRTRG